MDTPDITPRERGVIAEGAGINDQYLYQCLTGRAKIDATKAVKVERVSGQRIRRWHLRRDDWHEVWPELIGTEGAPDVPEEPAA